MLVAACCTVCIFVIGLRAEDGANTAPAPPMITLAAQHIFLSQIYYPGEERPRQPRSTVVFYFTGMDCAPCKLLMPHFLEVVRHVQEAGRDRAHPLRLFMVNTDSLGRNDEVLAYVNDLGINPDSEVLLDPYKKASEAFGVTGIPRIFVVSPHGEISASMTGMNFRGKEDVVQKRIEAFKRELAQELARAMRR